jgi:putative nucleotidyltransferase with HDIG domain
MNRQTKVFAVVIGFAAVVAFWRLLLLQSPATVSTHSIVGVLSFLAVSLVAECMSIDFGTGRQATSSLAFLPFISSVLLFSPTAATTVVALTLLFTTTVLSHQSWSKITFNLGQGILAAIASSVVYMAFLDGPERFAFVRTELSIVGFLFAALTFFGVNLLLTSGAIALLRSQGFGTTFIEVIGPRGANLWYDLLVSPIAIVPVALYESLYLAAMAIVLLPLLVIRYSYLSKLQLEHANRDLLSVLVKAIETRDPYTSGHSMRVATLARMIAEDIELPAKKLAEVERAALLHDIGKIDLIYASLLRKPYDLSTDERALIQTHATKGADLLQSLSSVSAEVVRGVRHHHERFDGTGYPSGLRGDEIPISARIIMLCDSIDAMLSDRPYRKALTVPRVRAELVRCSGGQFDPSIVQVILQKNTLERAVALVAAEGSGSPVTQLTAVAS